MALVNGEYIMRHMGTGEEYGLRQMIDHCCINSGVVSLKVLEIGSYRGESSDIMMSTGKVETLTCVDPWMNGYDDADMASYLTPMTEIERQFDLKVFKYGTRVTKVKNKSSNVYNTFSDETFDVVYIDGDHTYEGCKLDIVNYLPKVRKGGFLCGHDVHCEGVQKAIIETISGIDGYFPDSSWVKQV